MKSMTGYGRGECAQDGFKITVELSSVNRKQTEIAVYLPGELESLEPRVRDIVNRRIARGRLTVKMALHAGDEAIASKVQINFPLAKAYAREIARLAIDLKLKDAVTLDLIMRAPGVLGAGSEVANPDDFWGAMEKALSEALDALVAMRAREGLHLSADLQRRMDTMRQSVKRVQKSAPGMVKRFKEQLRERIRSAGLDTPVVDDERLLKEVIYFADRSDITEELTRLESHFKQFDDCVKSKDPVGRTLDFLAQEMNREINTIGSKAADSRISREVVKLKTELEKFREQVQNVE
jgi:uncharacterized protein (TIGR00255 family)